MARQKPKGISPRDDAAARRPKAPESPPARRLTAEQLRRWAELVACGEEKFPQGLSAADEQLLGREVRRHRRARLVRHITRAIAADIWRARQREDDHA